MDILKFSLIFTVCHAFAYIFAGAVALKISKDIYENKNRHCDFLRDMSDQEESRHVTIWFLPAQILRGFLMSMVLWPLLSALLEFSFILQFVFFSGLMFIYTHIAAVSPFIDNIEGFVYFKQKYLKQKFFLKFQFEMVIYSAVFGTLMGVIMKYAF